MDAGHDDPSPQVTAHPLSLLVVDDEPRVLALAAATLERRGYRVVSANDGLEAMEIFRTRSAEFSCVLLDLTMPILNGAQTYRRPQAIRPDLRAVLMSGYGEAEAMASFSADAPVVFLQKSFEPAQLASTLGKVLPGQ